MKMNHSTPPITKGRNTASVPVSASGNLMKIRKGMPGLPGPWISGLISRVEFADIASGLQDFRPDERVKHCQFNTSEYHTLPW
jgi:hypothetical protein